MSFGMYIKLEFRIFNVFFTTRINTHVSQIWPTSCQHSSSVWFNLKQSSQSDSSVIELDSDFVFIVLPTNTSVLLSPPSPVDLRSNFSNVALSSQASEESDIPASDVLLPGKKRVYKIHRGRFHKGQNVKRRPLTTSSQKIDCHLTGRNPNYSNTSNYHSPTSDTLSKFLRMTLTHLVIYMFITAIKWWIWT